MQRLSMIALTAIAVLALSGAAFISKPAKASAQTPAPGQTAAPTGTSQTAFATTYYWYDIINGGTYNDYEPLAYEIWEMEEMWGCQVDQNPDGGTLIEEGFLTPNPKMPVMIWLYGHFD
jgi:hypothetical protein